MPIFLRRKLVRRSGGSESECLICAISMISNCFFRLIGLFFGLALLFRMRLFQGIKYGKILRSAGGPFAFDDVGQGRDKDLIPAKCNSHSTRSDAFKGTYPGDSHTKVDLQ